MASAAALAQPYAEEYRLLVAYDAAELVNDSKKTFVARFAPTLVY